MPNSHSKQNRFFELVGRLAVTTAAYPIEYVKVLIQLGHEPYPPKASYTWTGRPCHTLTGCYEYMQYIKKVDGFSGLYRGLTPKLCTSFVAGAVFLGLKEVGWPNFGGRRIKKVRQDSETTVHRYGGDGSSFDDEDDEDILEVERALERSTFSTLLVSMCNSSLYRTLALIASHPLHVITIRTMGQFVGREKIYQGVLSSLAEVYHHEGFLGLYKGFWPRLLTDLLTLWISTMAAVLINKFIFKDKALKSYVNASTVYVASAITYPFILVSNVMCVNDSGLIVGDPPYTPHFSNWLECWRHLSTAGQLKRGSSILWRYYTAGNVVLLPLEQNANKKKLND